MFPVAQFTEATLQMARLLLDEMTMAVRTSAEARWDLTAHHFAADEWRAAWCD